jgi:hypothetical protein
MNKRNVASVLWFLAGWEAGGLLVGLMSLPWFLAYVPGIVLVLLVRWDPTGLFWSRPGTTGTSRPTRPINDVAAELDRATDRQSPTEAQQRRV